jgi:signal transduction histidine kinase
MDRAALNLEAVIHEVVESLNREIEEKKATVEVQRPLAAVYANLSTLKQVLANLISNALKFMEPGRAPHIRIQTERRDEAVRIWVEDNGIGIAAEHQDKVFGLFERLHNVTQYPGTGVGLAIVRKAMERMGGKVGLISKLAQGSRFWLELPVPPPATGVVEKDPVPALASSQG